MPQVRYRALIALDAVPLQPGRGEYHNHTHKLMVHAHCVREPAHIRYFPAELSWDDERTLHPGDRAEVTITIVDDEAASFFDCGQRFDLWNGSDIGHGTISRRVYSEYGPC